MPVAPASASGYESSTVCPICSRTDAVLRTAATQSACTRLCKKTSSVTIPIRNTPGPRRPPPQTGELVEARRTDRLASGFEWHPGWRRYRARFALPRAPQDCPAEMAHSLAPTIRDRAKASVRPVRRRTLECESNRCSRSHVPRAPTRAGAATRATPANGRDSRDCWFGRTWKCRPSWHHWRAPANWSCR